MHGNIELLITLYLTLKEYVPTKDRQAAADHIVSVIADSEINESELKIFGAADNFTKRAVAEYLHVTDDDDTGYNPGYGYDDGDD